MHIIDTPFCGFHTRKITHFFFWYVYNLFVTHDMRWCTSYVFLQLQMQSEIIIIILKRKVYFKE
jgi:hypothetical protein